MAEDEGDGSEQTDEPEPAEPPERVTPEVLDAGGSPSPPAPRTQVPLYRMVRVGLSVLIAIGVLVAFAGVRIVSDPDGFVCRSARTVIEDELDADEPDPAVAGLDSDTVDDLPCDEAVATAREVKDIPEESTASAFGIFALVAGLVMIGGGAYALLARTRLSRNIALAVAAVGIVPSTLFGLGIIGVAVMAFVIFAIAFSRDAKASFGPAGASGLFRPRVPPKEG